MADSTNPSVVFKSAWVVAPVAHRLGGLQQSMTRFCNLMPDEEFTGYA